MRLKNQSKRMVRIVLPHAEVCREVCYCTAVPHLKTALNAKTGETGIKQVDMTVPMSLHIPAGSETDDLPEELSKAAQVRRLLSVKVLRKVS